MSKARELASLGNAYSDGSLSNRRINQNGAMQVWQRGTSFTSGFNADRFTAGGVSSATKVVSSLAGFGSALRIVTNIGDPTFSQQIENYEGYLAGQTMTLSFWMKTDIAEPFAPSQFCEFYDGSNTYSFFAVDVPVVIETSGDWKRYARTFTLPSNATGYKFNARLDFNEVTSQTLDITGVQLEVGDTATPFEHRSYGQELALCQRYFQKLGGVAYQGIGVGKEYAARPSNMTFVPFLSTMRVAPTLAETGSGGLIVTDRVSYDDLVTSIEGAAIGTTSLYAQFVKGTARTDRVFQHLAVQGGGNGWLELDAEL